MDVFSLSFLLFFFLSLRRFALQKVYVNFNLKHFLLFQFCFLPAPWRKRRRVRAFSSSFQMFSFHFRLRSYWCRADGWNRQFVYGLRARRCIFFTCWWQIVNVKMANLCYTAQVEGARLFRVKCSSKRVHRLSIRASAINQFRSYFSKIKLRTKQLRSNLK